MLIKYILLIVGIFIRIEKTLSIDDDLNNNKVNYIAN